jgi:site-specific DNA-methyltransferase (adenine-specific)
MQLDVAGKIYTGKAGSVDEAVLQVQGDRKLAEDDPAPASDQGLIIFRSEDDFIKAAYKVTSKKKRDVLHGSPNDEYHTPQALFDLLNQEFNFTLDVSATHENAKCARFFTKEQDALKQSWACEEGDTGAGWMNHPYSLTYEFMQKAFNTAMNGDRTMVCLPKSDTDREWFWHFAQFGEVRFLKRVHFENAESQAPFTNCLVIFRRDMATNPSYEPNFRCWDWEKKIIHPVLARDKMRGSVTIGGQLFRKGYENSDDVTSPMIWKPYTLEKHKKMALA